MLGHGQQLEEAVATLPIRHRVVVALRVHLDNTDAEIADIVGPAPRYARQMYSRSTAHSGSLLGEVADDVATWIASGTARRIQTEALMPRLIGK